MSGNRPVGAYLNPGWGHGDAFILAWDVGGRGALKREDLPPRGSGPRSADDSPENQAGYAASGAHCFLGKSRAAVIFFAVLFSIAFSEFYIS